MVWAIGYRWQIHSRIWAQVLEEFDVERGAKDWIGRLEDGDRIFAGTPGPVCGGHEPHRPHDESVVRCLWSATLVSILQKGEALGEPGGMGVV